MADPAFEAWIEEVVARIGVRSFYAKVTGVTYSNDDGTSRQDAIKYLEPREPLLLEGQNDNPHDPKAVAVTTIFGDQIGYLERRTAAQVRHKGLWSAVVCRLTTTPNDKHGVIIVLIELRADATDEDVHAALEVERFESAASPSPITITPPALPELAGAPNKPQIGDRQAVRWILFALLVLLVAVVLLAIYE